MVDRHDGHDSGSSRPLLDHDGGVQLLLDPATGAIVDASPAACEFYGYPRQELLGKPITDINALPPQAVAAAMGEALSRSRSRFEFRHRLASGELRDVEVHSGPIQVAGRTLLHSIVHDVTDRKRADEALKRQVTAFDAAMDGMAVLDAQGRYLFLNEAHARIYGYERPEDLVGCDWRQLYEPHEAERIAASGMAELRRAGSWRGEGVGRRRDGAGFDQELSLSALPDGGLVCVVRDVTERKHAERVQSALYRISALAHGEADIDELCAGVHAIVGELTYARNFYIALYDRELDRLTFPYFVDEADPVPAPQPPGDSLTGLVLRTGQPLLADPQTFARLVREGHAAQVGANSVDWLGVPLERGDVTFGVLVVQSYSDDVRFTQADLELLTYVSQHVGAAIDRKRSSDALRESEARWRTLARTAPSAIFIYQGERFVYANDACLEISGRTRDEFLALKVWELPTPEFRDAVREHGERRQRGEDVPDRYEFRLLRKGGEERWLDYSAAVIEHEGQPAVLGMAFDITERKRAEEQIRQLAYHDPLTGLPNRLLCHDRLSVAIAQAHRHGQRLALLFLDLDRFKAVNDSLGHELGDRLLHAVAERLAAVVREGDTLARLGGDEFVLLLPGIPRAVDAVRVGQKVLDALRRPFELQGHELAVTASLGISLYPDDGTDAETLVKNADTAMYRAKQHGRDGYQLYAPAMNAAALERLALEHDLRRAQARDELELHYQPVLDLASGRVVEVEALLRWRRPHGLVSPGEFVPLAETTGLLATLSPWVLQRACAQAREWTRLEPGLGVTVNLSARQLQQPDLSEHVGAALRASGLEPRALRIDTTEAALERCGEAGVEALRRLKALGVGLVLDDFGAGTTSLRALRRLPLDAIKLDPELVHGSTADADQAALASAVIQLAHALHLQVIAEGVETEEQLAFLVAQRCDRMQGYLFSGPLPPAELGALLAARPAQDGRNASVLRRT